MNRLLQITISFTIGLTACQAKDKSPEFTKQIEQAFKASQIETPSATMAAFESGTLPALKDVSVSPAPESVSLCSGKIPATINRYFTALETQTERLAAVSLCEPTCSSDSCDNLTNLVQQSARVATSAERLSGYISDVYLASIPGSEEALLNFQFGAMKAQTAQAILDLILSRGEAPESADWLPYVAALTETEDAIARMLRMSEDANWIEPGTVPINRVVALNALLENVTRFTHRAERYPHDQTESLGRDLSAGFIKLVNSIVVMDSWSSLTAINPDIQKNAPAACLSDMSVVSGTATELFRLGQLATAGVCPDGINCDIAVAENEMDSDVINNLSAFQSDLDVLAGTLNEFGACQP